MRLPEIVRRFGLWLAGESVVVDADDQSTPAESKGAGNGLRRAIHKIAQDGKPAGKYDYPVSPPHLPPGVVPQGEKAPVMAMDLSPYQIGNGLLCGTGFPGFTYLSMLATRAEYRAFASAMATEITREWIEWTSSETDDDATKDKIKRIEEVFKQLNIRGVIGAAVEQDCFFGRAQIFIKIRGADDKLPLILAPQTVPKNSLVSVTPVEAIWTTPTTYNSIDPTAPDFYRPPMWFMLGREVNADRLMTIITRPLPDILKAAFNFAGMSLSQLAEPYVDNWLRTRQSVSDLINNFSITVLKTNMAQILQGTDDGSDLMDRIAFFTGMRSNKGMMALDKDAEELGQVNTPLSGLSELQTQSQMQMSSVSRIPPVVLSGISPTGLNANSDGEIRVFYDWIAAQQDAYWRYPIEQISKVVQLSEFGEIDPTINFTFKPLYQMTPKELAEIRKSDADADAVYLDRGVLAPEEVRERVAADPLSGYNGLDTSVVPVPPIEPKGEKDPGKGDPAQDAEFDESKHPRDDDGKFGSGSGGSSGAGSNISSGESSMQLSKSESNNLTNMLAAKGMTHAAATEKLKSLENSNPEQYKKAVEQFRKDYSEKFRPVATSPSEESGKINPGQFLWTKDDNGKSTMINAHLSGAGTGTRVRYDLRVNKDGHWKISENGAIGKPKISEGEGGEKEAMSHMADFILKTGDPKLAPGYERSYNRRTLTGFGPAEGGLSFEYSTGKATKAGSLPSNLHRDETTATAEKKAAVQSSRQYLNVPYSDKDSAKSAGAKWDPDKKKWYFPKESGDLPDKLKKYAQDEAIELSFDQEIELAESYADADADAVYLDRGVLAPEEVRERVAADPLSGYNGLDTSVVPVPPIEPKDEKDPSKDGPAQDSDFDESKHPRDDDGKFGSGGGGSSQLSESQRNDIARSQKLYQKYGGKEEGSRGKFKELGRSGQLDHLWQEHLENEMEDQKLADAQIAKAKADKAEKNSAWREKHLPKLAAAKNARLSAERDEREAKVAAAKEYKSAISSTEKTYLNVPYALKDEAKGAGAKWDADSKKWFFPSKDVPAKLQKFTIGKKESIETVPPKSAPTRQKYPTHGRIDSADPSIYGSWLLGHEGESWASVAHLAPEIKHAGDSALMLSIDEINDLAENYA